MHRILLPLHISGRPPSAGVIALNGETMGTSWSVKLAAEQPAEDLHAAIRHELDTVVAQMSHWEPDSDLCRFNRAPAASWHVLPPAFFEVLSYALEVARDTDGAYDPAVGALVNLWGFGPVNRHDQPGFSAPADAQVQALIARPGWRHIELDPALRRARQPGGALLDFSSVAKGYAVDRVAGLLERRGVRDYLVEVGGELRGAGMKPDGQPWWVALEQPEQGGASTLLALHGLAVATSGDYRRFYRLGDRRCPHTLDPRTGYPIDNRIASVTLIHPQCMAADALSTALTVLGVERGMCFAESRMLAARFLVRDGDRLVEHTSSAFLEMLQ